MIENASMSDKGAFLLVKRARDAKYTVSLYDSSFRNKVNYYKSRFVADAAISPDGKQAVIVTLGNAGADVSCSVELYDFGRFGAAERQGLYGISSGQRELFC